MNDDGDLKRRLEEEAMAATKSETDMQTVGKKKKMATQLKN